MERPFSHRRTFDLPFEQMVHVLRDEPGVLVGLAREAAVDLAATMPSSGAHVMAPAATPVTMHDVEVVIAAMQVVDQRTVMVPIEWVAVDGLPWFPSVEGEIEVIQLDDKRPWTELAFFGTYTPRMRGLGAVIDATATHWAVEATLAAFFEAACIHLEETIATEQEIATG